VSRRVRERGIAHKDLLRVRRVCLEVGRVLGL
jgi:hypothetical protein